MKLLNIIFEAVTVSDFLKKEENKEKVLVYKESVMAFLAEKMPQGIRKDILLKFVNWFIKELIRNQITEDITHAVITNWWANVGDWITTNYTNLQSKFNTLEFTYENAIEESEKWHEKLKNNTKLKPGREGRVVVDLSDVSGFSGWNWVALDRSKCSIEGDVMGHCGNSAGHHSQNILSLRDPNNIPHLTFINNKGTLGEMKGKGNSKPSKKYHPAIMKLLLSDEVGAIEGGGYMPQNNFQFSDLSEEDKTLVLAAKPKINDPEFFKQNRESLMKREYKKRNNKLLSDANSDEEIDSAVNKIIKTKLNLWDEQKPDHLDKGIVVAARNQTLETFNYLLGFIYERSKKTFNPDELFKWMDKTIESFIKEIILKDLETYRKLDEKSKHIFTYISNVLLLDKYIMAQYQKQPEIMQAAPKRNRFKNFQEYEKNLRYLLSNHGFELPPYKPKTNMISYEFLVKFGQEISKQGNQMFKTLG